MKTKLQDLDDKTFKELISDKLGRGHLYKENYINDCTKLHKIQQKHPLYIADCHTHKLKQKDHSNYKDVPEPKINHDDHSDQEQSWNDDDSSLDSPPIPVLEREEPLTYTESERETSYSCQTLKRLDPNSIPRHAVKKICRCQQCELNNEKGSVLRRQDYHVYDSNDGDSESSSSCSLKLSTKNTVNFDPFDKNSFKCLQCGKKYETYESLKRHRRSHKNKDAYVCDVCRQSFHSWEYLKIHKTIQHQQHTSGKVLNKCTICGAGFRWHNNLLAHLKTHSDKNGFQCDACGEQFPNRLFLKEHMKTHVEHRLHQCHVCEARFLTESTLRNHLQKHDSDAPYKCVVCGEGFVWENSLEEHVLNHIGIYPYKCVECGAGFHHEDHLKEHALVHEKRAYCCKMCPKIYSSKHSLDKHVMSKHKLHKVYKCTMCKETFNNKSSMKKHILNHMVNIYSCDICAKQFRTRATLIQHKNLHSDISCHNDKSSELEAHDVDVDNTLSKTLDMTCRCLICGEGYPRLKDLEKHIEICHDMKQHQCDFCDEKFVSEGDLESHLSKHHFKKDKTLAFDVSKHIEKTLYSSNHYVTKSDLVSKMESDVEMASNLLAETGNENPASKRIKEEPMDVEYLASSKIVKSDNYTSKESNFSASGSTVVVDAHHFHQQNGGNMVVSPHPSGSVSFSYHGNCSNIYSSRPLTGNQGPFDTIYSPCDTENVTFSTGKSETIDCHQRGNYSEVDSVYSPQSTTFSPRGKHSATDTDSGYSDKMNHISSDVESVYSPLGFDLNGPNNSDKGNDFGKWNTTLKGQYNNGKMGSELHGDIRGKLNDVKIRSPAMQLTANKHSDFNAENELGSLGLYTEISEIVPIEQQNTFSDGGGQYKYLTAGLEGVEGLINTQETFKIKDDPHLTTVSSNIVESNDSLSHSSASSDNLIGEKRTVLHIDSFNLKEEQLGTCTKNELKTETRKWGFYNDITNTYNVPDVNINPAEKNDIVQTDKVLDNFISLSSQSPNHVHISHEKGAITSDKAQSHISVSVNNSKSSETKPRVPFFFSQPKNKRTMQQVGGINFHWLGKLK